MKNLNKSILIALGMALPLSVMASPDDVTIRMMEANEQATEAVTRHIELPEAAERLEEQNRIRNQNRNRNGDMDGDERDHEMERAEEHEREMEREREERHEREMDRDERKDVEHEGIDREEVERKGPGRGGNS